MLALLALLFLLLAIVPVVAQSDELRRGTVVATAYRWSFANKTESAWIRAESRDCARFLTVSMTRLHYPTVLESEQHAAVQFEVGETLRYGTQCARCL